MDWLLRANRACPRFRDASGRLRVDDHHSMSLLTYGVSGGSWYYSATWDEAMACRPEGP